MGEYRMHFPRSGVTECFRRPGQRAASAGHVVHQQAGPALHIPQYLEMGGHVESRPEFRDDCQVRVHGRGITLGALETPSVRGHDGEIRQFPFPEPRKERLLGP